LYFIVANIYLSWQNVIGVVEPQEGKLPPDGFEVGDGVAGFGDGSSIEIFVLPLIDLQVISCRVF
jgi:hypothetical protein